VGGLGTYIRDLSHIRVYVLSSILVLTFQVTRIGHIFFTDLDDLYAKKSIFLATRVPFEGLGYN